MAALKLRRVMPIAIVVCVSMASLAGCNGMPPPVDRADYTATLDRYYQGRPACLWSDSVKFPIENAPPEEIKQQGFAALVDAGMLVRKPARKGSRPGSYSFDLSPEGRSAFDRDIDNPGAGNFCNGRHTVTSIDRALHPSPSTELVDFQYSVGQPAAWAKEYSITRAFPQVVAELSGTHKAEATLLYTTDGWEVSGQPAIVNPLAAGPHDSALTRAKTVLHLGRRQAS